MESFFGRYRNPLVLMAVLFVQIIALATQVKRPLDPKTPSSPKTRLIRVWTVTAFTPIEHALVGTSHFFRHGWHDYVDLHDVRKQNQELQAEVTRLRMEQIRMKDDVEQGRRLQALLGFRERFISQTVAAQVIGTSGSERSRVIYIDKGSQDGIKTDMAVITPDGIVGKIKDAFPWSSQVLMINDHDSGAGVILEKSRLQGVLRGTNTGELQVEGVMADQAVESGEPILASGGDRIYPKGMPVGVVSSVAPDRDTGTFLLIKIKPAADLNRLEEVLVITRMAEQAPEEVDNQGRVRAADILAQRLPSVPKANLQPGAPGTIAPDKKPDILSDKKDDKKNPKTGADLKNSAGANSAANTGNTAASDKKTDHTFDQANANKKDDKKSPKTGADLKSSAGGNSAAAVNTGNNGQGAGPATQPKAKKPPVPAQEKNPQTAPGSTAQALPADQSKKQQAAPAQSPPPTTEKPPQ